jgi:hypothetical protein
MPVVRNDFDRFTDTERAQYTALEAVGLALIGDAVNEYDVQGINVVTSNLINSHAHEVSMREGCVYVGVTADYGGYVHNGTSRNRARPWLRKALEKNADKLQELAARKWKEALE